MEFLRKCSLDFECEVHRWLRILLARYGKALQLMRAGRFHCGLMWLDGTQVAFSHLQNNMAFVNSQRFSKKISVLLRLWKEICDLIKIQMLSLEKEMGQLRKKKQNLQNFFYREKRTIGYG